MQLLLRTAHAHGTFISQYSQTQCSDIYIIGTRWEMGGIIFTGSQSTVM